MPYTTEYRELDGACYLSGSRQHPQIIDWPIDYYIVEDGLTSTVINDKIALGGFRLV